MTFLFTDIEDSTRLWEEHPDAMRVGLARHDDLLRQSIEANGGYVVKTTGDGFHAAFLSATDALTAASAVQVALGEESWGVLGPLRVRIGLHTCEAQLRDGDYFGSGVNRAARLMSIAHGGQIVLSAATAELARDQSLEVIDLGEHTLRGLVRTERVLQLCPPGLPCDFPPLRSVDDVGGNLPLQATPFVGRDSELDDLGQLLRSARLVTLTGPGGVGKTRLAIESALRFGKTFSDGTWLVDLTRIDEPEFVVAEVAATMGLGDRLAGSSEAALARSLRRRDVLIILDNCEHVIDAVAAFAAQVLANCPTVVLLATSQEMLGVDGEVAFAVRPFPLPDLGVAIPVDELVANESVHLFQERARAARHGFAVTADNAGAVAELCGRLDGIPLAIELAAARVSSMSPAAILDRIDERFRLLGRGRRGSRKRHETLRAALDWSYSLLDPVERLVFARLAVFVGSFTLEAAEAVVTDDAVGRDEIVDVLASLVAKSMLLTDDEAASDDRYRLLETMRDYGREQLLEAGDLETRHRAHAAYFQRLAEVAAPHLVGPNDSEWFGRLDADEANLRAALAFLRDGHDADFIAMAFALVHFWRAEGHLREGLAWTSAALAAQAPDPTPDRARLMGLMATFALNLSLWEQGRELARGSLECSEALGEPPRSIALVALGLDALVHDQPDDARHFGMQALTVARAADDRYDLAEALMRNSLYFSLTGDPIRGAELADEAVDVTRTIGNDWITAGALEAAGIARHRDEPTLAIELLSRSLETSAVRERATMGSQSRFMMAVAHVGLRQYADAARELQKAIPRMQDEGEDYYQSMALGLTCVILQRTNRAEPALKILATIDHLRRAGRFVGATADLDSQARLKTRLEQQLLPERFDELWRDGQAMHLDDAVTLALEQLRATATAQTDDS